MKNRIDQENEQCTFATIEMPNTKDRTPQQIPGLRHWCMKVELTWPIEDQDVTPQYGGDAEVDFARRVVYDKV